MPVVAAIGLRGDGVPTGFATLDRRLPADGWPRRALTEVRWAAAVGSTTCAAPTSTVATGTTAKGIAATASLDAGAGFAEAVGLADTNTSAVLRLVAPSITAALDAGRTVMLFDPPADCSAGLLARCGIDPAALLVVDGRDGARPGAGSVWLMERALASGEVGAVLGWLPAGLPDGLWQRLCQAARQHDGPAFVVVEPDRCMASDHGGDAGDGSQGGRTAGRDAGGPVPSFRSRPETGDRLLLRLIAGTGDDDGQGDDLAGVSLILAGLQAAVVGAPVPSRQGRVVRVTRPAHRGGIAAGLTVLAGGLQRPGFGSATAPRPSGLRDARRRVVPRLASSSLALELPPLRLASSCPFTTGEVFDAAVFVDLGG